MIVAFDAARQLHVVLGDAADAAVHERQLDLVALELLEALGERLERALDVGLEDQVERGDLAPLDLLEDVLELGPGADRRASPPARPRCGSAARRASATVLAVLSFGATRSSSPASGTSDSPSTWTGVDGGASLMLLALVVDEGADRAPRRAGDHRVADAQRAALDEDGGHRAPARRRGWPRARCPGPAPRGWP